jgi:hypothetical protein
MASGVDGVAGVGGLSRCRNQAVDVRLLCCRTTPAKQGSGASQREDCDSGERVGRALEQDHLVAGRAGAVGVFWLSGCFRGCRLSG